MKAQKATLDAEKESGRVWTPGAPPSETVTAGGQSQSLQASSGGQSEGSSPPLIPGWKLPNVGQLGFGTFNATAPFSEAASAAWTAAYQDYLKKLTDKYFEVLKAQKAAATGKTQQQQ